MKIDKLDSKNNPIELLPQIIDRIFSICKLDPSFQLKDELEIVENKKLSLQHKIDKQNDLFKQSEKMKEDVLQRIEIIAHQNEQKQAELLEAIGSE